MPIHTGLPALDDDLASLAKFLASVKDELKIPDSVKVTSKWLDEALPKHHFDVAMLLLSSNGFESLEGMVQNEELPELRGLREQVQGKLGKLLNDDRMKAKLRGRVEEMKEFAGKRERDLRIPDEISSIPYLQPRSQGKFEPAVRLFLANDHITISDMTLDWDDLSFILEGVAQTFETSVRGCESLLKNGQIDIAEKDYARILRRIQSTVNTCNDLLKHLEQERR